MSGQKPEENQWMKVAGAAAAVGSASALIYYFFFREEKFYFDPETDRLEDITPSQAKMILEGVMTSQEDMEKLMAGLLEKIHEQSMTFEEVCISVARLQPRDILKEYNLTMEAFSGLLDIHKNEPMLQPLIMKLTYGSAKKEMTPGAENVTKNTVVEVHKFMVDQLREIHGAIEQTNSINHSSRVVTIAAQAYIAGKVFSKYKLKSFDLECLVAKHQEQLIGDQGFIDLSATIREIMGKLVDAAQ